MVRWLEVSADYRCNNRCLGCFSVDDHGPSLSTREAAETLADGRRRGARSLWLGGGEPTLRGDLPKLVRLARSLGYEHVKVQTNGMLLSYAQVADRLVDAGVTEVSFSIKGATAETHDHLTRTPGCFALMLDAIGQMRRRGVVATGDILVYTSNAHELPDVVRRFTPLGLERYDVWLLSAAGGGSDLDAIRGEVPRISDVIPRIVEAMDLGLSDRPDFITSLHTPPCTVPETHRACLFHAAELDLLVANPGGYTFRLEESPIEGGAYLDRCAGCALRPRCGGPRADYRAIHGDDEFQPPAGQERGTSRE